MIKYQNDNIYHVEKKMYDPSRKIRFDVYVTNGPNVIISYIIT